MKSSNKLSFRDRDVYKRQECLYEALCHGLESRDHHLKCFKTGLLFRRQETAQLFHGGDVYKRQSIRPIS